MSEQLVPGYLILEMVVEQEDLLTIEWYRKNHPDQVKALEARVPKPDVWYRYDERASWAEYRNEQKRVVFDGYLRYRKAFLERWNRVYDLHIARYGWWFSSIAGRPLESEMKVMLHEMERHDKGLGECECDRRELDRLASEVEARGMVELTEEVA